MNLKEAVIELIWEARADRSSNASAKRTVKALKALSLSSEDIVSVMTYLDYCKGNGEPYLKPDHPRYIQRCW